MIGDAHVHVGYWCKAGGLKYYSPRRVIGVLGRCGVDQCIVSSTSPQAGTISEDDLIREAREVIRASNGRAHMYCWITGEMYDRDQGLAILGCGHYDGIKLHECETPWNGRRRSDLEKILAIAERRRMNVMFHCGQSGECSPLELSWAAEAHPNVRFNFAHCRPVKEIATVMRKCGNVYTDISCLPVDDVRIVLSDESISGRVMFGSDFPAVFDHAGLTQGYRRRQHEIMRLGRCQGFETAFRSFTARADAMRNRRSQERLL